MVEKGRRYVIKSRSVTSLQLFQKAKIVEELVEEAKRQEAHMRLLLLDKGFYSHEVIKALKALRVKFLIAVPQNSRAKEEILDYFRTGKRQVRGFSLLPNPDCTISICIPKTVKLTFRTYCESEQELSQTLQ